MTLDEAISAPFKLDLDLVSQDEVVLENVLEKECFLTIHGASADRHVHGIISSFERVTEGNRHIIYKATVVPRLWFLGLRTDNRIFQNKNIKEILTSVLEAAQIKSDQIEFRLEGQYESREYCVQFRETDLAFISRLIQHEGIFYFFEHTNKSHKIIFADGRSAYQPIDGASTLMFNKIGLLSSDEAVLSFSSRKKVKSGKVTLNDFNPDQPSTPMDSHQEGNAGKNHEVYDYPGSYENTDTGKRLAKVRLEEKMVMREFGQGATNSPNFMPGRTFVLKSHPNSSFNKKYLLLASTQTGTQPQVVNADEGADTFSVHFSVIPADTTYRPERTTSKPMIYGPQTAIVVGPAGEEIYTDDQGRVKVQFHWDRQGKKDEKSSCWIRVSQPHAGAGFGAVSLPRIGEEVIVSFLDGDPDRPIITGRVYNGANPAPHGLPDNKTKSSVKTNSTPGGGGYNELSFEDKKGEEEVFLHGQKDMTIAIENDKNQTIGKNETLAVGENKSESVGGHKNETVAKTSNESILLSKTLNVGAGYAINVGGALVENVVGAKNTAVGGAHADEVGLSRATVVGKNSSTNIGKDESVAVAENSKKKVGKKYQINAGDEFELTVGSASIKLNKSGKIEITGVDITIKSGGGTVSIDAGGIISAKGPMVKLNT
jgi:type VI secretion system secreted protein VgrG